MKEQLTKLNLWEKLQGDVEDLKQSVQSHVALVLKEEKASLRAEVNKLKSATTEATKNILDLQCRSMRDNIIVHGLPEEQTETYHSTEQTVKRFLSAHLKMKDNDITNIHFDTRNHPNTIPL